MKKTVLIIILLDTVCKKSLTTYSFGRWFIDMKRRQGIPIFSKGVVVMNKHLNRNLNPKVVIN